MKKILLMIILIFGSNGLLSSDGWYSKISKTLDSKNAKYGASAALIAAVLYFFRKDIKNWLWSTNSKASNLEIPRSYQYDFFETQGELPSMEIAHFIERNSNHIFFGIFDGHYAPGGWVADYLSQNLYRSVLQNLYRSVWQNIFFRFNPGQALLQGFADMNQVLSTKPQARLRTLTSGSTAIVGLIKSGKIYIANLGDSRAVLAKDDQAVPLSKDHVPANELNRIKTLNNCEAEIENDKWVWNIYLPWENYRTSFTRSFGYLIFAPAIIQTPEILEHTISNQDQFLILASHGVWDVITSQQAVEIIRDAVFRDFYRINRQEQAVDNLAQILVERAIDFGSNGNISALVVKLY
jgi:protein phosphatase 1L